MSFKTMAIITAIVGLVLGLGYVFAGSLIVGRWHIEPTVSVLLLSKRIGSLYLGLSALFFLSRSAPQSTARTAISAGTSIALLLLTLFGIREFTAGHAGRGILISALLEFLIALGFIRVLFTERKAGK